MDAHEILSKLSAGAIQWQDALAALKALPPSWQTKQWKQRRLERLGPCCEACGTTKPPLVMQHTWHPSTIEWLFKNERRNYTEQWKEWRDARPIQVDTSHLIPDADGCPKCGSPTVRFRKRAGHWKCVAMREGVTCGYTFSTPIRVVSYAAVHVLELAARKVVQEAFDDHYGIGLRVANIALQQHLQYISLADTKTLCKRCAFVEDKTSLVLCEACKENYHSRYKPCCDACAGIDTSERKAYYAFLNGKASWSEEPPNPE